MTQIFNRKEELEKRVRLRAGMTIEEKILWARLRNRQLSGYKFRRQYSIGPYIVDFFCPSEKLALEIDGEIHSENNSVEYDAERKKYIESIGIKILRCSNKEVREDPEKVLRSVMEMLKKK